MQYEENVLAFACCGEQLFGVLSMPEQVQGRPVLVVVGGPQYRVGSHRQFALLARSLAGQGIPALRFDYRGMGDSTGAARQFEAVGDDLRAAVDALLAAVPAAREVVIWGLCDAASAAVFYAAGDARVRGLVLLNPWVRTPAGAARATLKHYYRQRLFDPALWKKIFSGNFNVAAAGQSFARLLGAARTPAPAARSDAAPRLDASTDAGTDAGANAGINAGAADADAAAGPALPERMLGSLSQFTGKVLLIMSGADLTAREFSDLVKASRPWRRQLAAARVTRRDLAEADHTFSRRVWRDQVADWTASWVRSW